MDPEYAFRNLSRTELSRRGEALRKRSGCFALQGKVVASCRVQHLMISRISSTHTSGSLTQAFRLLESWDYGIGALIDTTNCNHRKPFFSVSLGT